jgi:hypothetical protein
MAMILTYLDYLEKFIECHTESSTTGCQNECRDSGSNVVCTNETLPVKYNYDSATIVCSICP